MLPVLEYCSPDWVSAANSHLALLDRIVCKATGLKKGIINCDLWHRRRVAALSVFFKIRENVGNTIRQWIPPE